MVHLFSRFFRRAPGDSIAIVEQDEHNTSEVDDVNSDHAPPQTTYDTDVRFYVYYVYSKYNNCRSISIVHCPEFSVHFITIPVMLIAHCRLHVLHAVYNVNCAYT